MTTNVGGAAPKQSATTPTARAVAVVIIGVLLVVLIASLAVYISAGRLHPGILDGNSNTLGYLAELGIPASWYVTFRVLVELVRIAVSVTAATFILRRSSSTGFTAFLAVVLVALTVLGGGAPLLFAELWPALSGSAVGVVQGIVWCSFFVTLAYLFPNGRFVPRWTMWLVPAWFLWMIWASLAIGAGGTVLILIDISALALLASCVWAPIYRYRKVSDSVERQQTKWVLWALGLQLLYLLWAIASASLPIVPESATGFVVATVISTIGYAFTTLVPAAVALAILRYRLFEVDLVINRTLVYGALTAFVVSCYLLIVGGIGLLWPGSGSFALPLLATAAVAVVFNPVRIWVQRRVNRLVYGERDDPYAVVSRLGDRLGSTLDTATVLQTIVTTIGAVMRLPRVAIMVNGLPEPVVAGAATTNPVRFVLRDENETLGWLEVHPRPGEQIRAADRRLLERLASQAGLAVRASILDDSLRKSREQILAVREDERRRLHRDLHDGLGPTLASLYQRLDIADRVLDSNGGESHRLIAESKSQLVDTIDEVRRLVHLLRPPALDELGLASALREAWYHGAEGLRIEVNEPNPLRALPAAIEVAAYRIAMEAVTNVSRHADARHCAVTLEMDARALVLSITDDGRGAALSGTPGTGIRSMRERAEEVGGTLELRENTPAGTIVTAVLPLRAPA